MARHLFTLLTDFGTTDSYVAQMKGEILCRCPDCHLVDITHDISPQDVRCAARVLAESLPSFPKHTTHLVVVDPGVGTDRRILAVEIADQFLVLPDNGLLTLLLQKYQPRRVHCVENKELWNASVSPTFHGRDIIAPVAVFLAMGGAWETIGPATDEFIQFEIVEGAQRLSHDRWRCSVQSQDRFGNLVLGSTAELLEWLQPGKSVELSCCETGSRTVRVVKTYGEGQPGELVLLRDSQNRLELAQVNGSASQAMDLHPHGSVKFWLVST